MERIEAARGDLLGGLDQHGGASAPSSDWVILVEPTDVDQRLREPLQRGGRFKFREYQLGPLLTRAGPDRPVRCRIVDDGAALLDRWQLILADQCRINVIEESGRCRAAEADPGAALVTEREDAVAVPRRDELQRLRVGIG